MRQKKVSSSSSASSSASTSSRSGVNASSFNTYALPNAKPFTLQFPKSSKQAPKASEPSKCLFGIVTPSARRPSSAPQLTSTGVGLKEEPEKRAKPNATAKDAVGRTEAFREAWHQLFGRVEGCLKEAIKPGVEEVGKFVCLHACSKFAEVPTVVALAGASIADHEYVFRILTDDIAQRKNNAKIATLTAKTTFSVSDAITHIYREFSGEHFSAKEHCASELFGKEISESQYFDETLKVNEHVSRVALSIQENRPVSLEELVDWYSTTLKVSTVDTSSASTFSKTYSRRRSAAAKKTEDDEVPLIVLVEDAEGFDPSLLSGLLDIASHLRRDECLPIAFVLGVSTSVRFIELLVGPETLSHLSITAVDLLKSETVQNRILTLLMQDHSALSFVFSERIFSFLLNQFFQYTNCISMFLKVLYIVCLHFYSTAPFFYLARPSVTLADINSDDFEEVVSNLMLEAEILEENFKGLISYQTLEEREPKPQQESPRSGVKIDVISSRCSTSSNSNHRDSFRGTKWWEPHPFYSLLKFYSSTENEKVAKPSSSRKDSLKESLLCELKEVVIPRAMVELIERRRAFCLGMKLREVLLRETQQDEGKRDSNHLILKQLEWLRLVEKTGKEVALGSNVRDKEETLREDISRQCDFIDMQLKIRQLRNLVEQYHCVLKVGLSSLSFVPSPIETSEAINSFSNGNESATISKESASVISGSIGSTTTHFFANYSDHLRKLQELLKELQKPRMPLVSSLVHKKTHGEVSSAKRVASPGRLSLASGVVASTVSFQALLSEVRTVVEDLLMSLLTPPPHYHPLATDLLLWVPEFNEERWLEATLFPSLSDDCLRSMAGLKRAFRCCCCRSYSVIAGNLPSNAFAPTNNSSARANSTSSSFRARSCNSRSSKVKSNPFSALANLPSESGKNLSSSSSVIMSTNYDIDPRFDTLPSMEDLTILYRLYERAGKTIELWDWFCAFCYEIVRPHPNPLLASQQKLREELLKTPDLLQYLKLRFGIAVGGLAMFLGVIKPPNATALHDEFATFTSMPIKGGTVVDEEAKENDSMEKRKKQNGDETEVDFNDESSCSAAQAGNEELQVVKEARYTMEGCYAKKLHFGKVWLRHEVFDRQYEREELEEQKKTQRILQKINDATKVAQHGGDSQNTKKAKTKTKL